jgi:signal transduction histidine kinase
MTHYFYIASELITNLLKHSYPKNIEMSLSLQDTNMEFKIKHDGIALSQRDYELLSNDSDSLGLGNIRYRLHTIKGSICFKKLKTFGTIQLNTQLTN